MLIKTFPFILGLSATASCIYGYTNNPTQANLFASIFCVGCIIPNAYFTYKLIQR